MSLTTEQINAAKARGFLRNRGTDNFSGRIVGRGGVFSAQQLAAIAQCASLYGEGIAITTSRMCIEVPGIPYEKLDAAAEYLTRETGLAFGGTGAKVRPVTACKGTTCVYGNIDTRALAAEIHDRYYLGKSDMKLPHKFKIGVGGCPNSCVKPSLNDIGIEGVRLVERDMDACRGCAKCQVEQACPMKACDAREGKLRVRADICNQCGVCVGKCPFGAVKEDSKSAYRVYVGGTWGKRIRIGTPIEKLFTRDEALDLIERSMEWYAKNGQAKERFGMTIDRLGMDKYLEEVLP